jgi:hypothetical protein
VLEADEVVLREAFLFKLPFSTAEAGPVATTAHFLRWPNLAFSLDSIRRGERTRAWM